MERSGIGVHFERRVMQLMSPDEKQSAIHCRYSAKLSNVGSSGQIDLADTLPSIGLTIVVGIQNLLPHKTLQQVWNACSLVYQVQTPCYIFCQMHLFPGIQVLPSLRNQHEKFQIQGDERWALLLRDLQLLVRSKVQSFS